MSVERIIHAPPGEIFALLADAGRHSSFDGSGTLNHSTGSDSGPTAPLTKGSTFGMAMRGRPETLFLPYRTTNTVVEFEPDRLIAWQTTAFGGLIGGRIWRYELSPDEGTLGTLVRETWDVSQERVRAMVTAGSLPKQTADGMHATLDRIAELLEK